MFGRLDVPDWFYPEFVDAVMAAFPIPGWPELGTDEGDVFWDVLGATLLRRHVTESEARQAIVVMNEDPPSFPDRLSGRFFKALDLIIAEDQKKFGGKAKAAPKGDPHCPDCNGTGFASRFDHRPDAAKVDLTLYCTCPFGEHLATYQDETARRRTPRLADRPEFHLHEASWSRAGLVNRYQFRREDWDEELNQPAAHAMRWLRMAPGDFSVKAVVRNVRGVLARDQRELDREAEERVRALYAANRAKAAGSRA